MKSLHAVEMASVYPKIPVNPETYRLTILQGILERLKKDLQDYDIKSKEFRGKLDRYRTSSKLLGSLGTAVGVAGGTLGATGVGVPIGASLIGLGALMGASSVVCIKLEKRIFDKLNKYDTLVALATSKLRSIEVKISNALADKRIDEKEFEDIYQEEGKYLTQKAEILNPVKLVRQSKNSSSTRELADQLAQALKQLKRSSQSM